MEINEILAIFMGLMLAVMMYHLNKAVNDKGHINDLLK